ncbi:MAG: hypothetical protein WDK95_11650 [Syntrophorhabdaceae bacterium]
MFCYLEHDQKTFEYLKTYFEKKDIDLGKVDIKIQEQEIKDHLKRNGKCESDNREICDWIDNNAKNFRQYLNTIKIIFLVCKISGFELKDVTWEVFCRLEDKVNNLKDNVLEKIFE